MAQITIEAIHVGAEHEAEGGGVHPALVPGHKDNAQKIIILHASSILGYVPQLRPHPLQPLGLVPQPQDQLPRGYQATHFLLGAGQYRDPVAHGQFRGQNARSAVRVRGTARRGGVECTQPQEL